MYKLYYIYESTAGCFGAPTSGKRLQSRYTNFRAATKNMKRLPQIKGTASWIDFDWIEFLRGGRK